MPMRLAHNGLSLLHSSMYVYPFQCSFLFSPSEFSSSCQEEDEDTEDSEDTDPTEDTDPEATDKNSHLVW